MTQLPYGWRAKIGLIIPSTGNAPEVEFHRPTIGSVHATLWHTLRCLGIHDKLPLGRLFEL
jgi:maleate cis-trans isomerase